MSTWSRAEARLQAKLEAERQIKRDVILRELKFSQITLGKREKEWKKLLMNISIPHMKEEMEFAWISFERAMDNKDMAISLLMEELRDAEEQYTMNCKSHIEHIDELINMFRERMRELKQEYNNQIRELEKSTEEEVGSLTETFNEDENYLKTILYILEVGKKEQKANARAEYFNKLEEEETKNTQIMQKLRALLEATNLNIETETDTFLADYQAQVDKRQQEYEELKAHDDTLKKVLDNQIEKIKKMYDAIKRLKENMLDSQKYLSRRLKDLENELQFFNNAFNILKKRLEEDRQLDAKKLECLTVSHNETMQYLEKIKQKGEHILQVAAVCRKLETQEEKILPFPSIDIKEAHRYDLDEISEYNKSLDLFWQKVAQAEASRYAIIEEREFLRTENEILRKQLHEYCQCINCPTPQTEANKKLNWPPYINAVSMNVTEGINEVKKYDKHNAPYDRV